MSALRHRGPYYIIPTHSASIRPLSIRHSSQVRTLRPSRHRESCNIPTSRNAQTNTGHCSVPTLNLISTNPKPAMPALNATYTNPRPTLYRINSKPTQNKSPCIDSSIMHSIPRLPPPETGNSRAPTPNFPIPGEGSRRRARSRLAGWTTSVLTSSGRLWPL